MSFLCALPFIAALFSACATPPPLAVGYVEGDYVLLAPIESVRLQSLKVREGDNVTSGAVVATFEDDDARLGVAAADAALTTAQAQLADLHQGRRPEEIAVLEAALRSALAQAAETRRALERMQDLARRGIAPEADLERAQTTVELAEAATGQAQANLAVARLPARQEMIRAATSEVERASAAFEQAQWRLEKRKLTAPADGRISMVIRNEGEMAGPASPILSLLPEGAIRLKLYVPEPQFSALRVGSSLALSCDGCPQGLSARVTYAAPEPEFTPPVIYSLATRQKLVHLVEAKPENDTTGALKPGQIVDVRLMP